MTVAQILDLADKIEKDELKIDDLVDGLMDFNEELDRASRTWTTTSKKRTRTTKRDAGAIAAREPRAAQGRGAGALRADPQASTRACSRCCRRKATRRRSTSSYQKKISGELMQIRFSARQVERLCDSVRTEVDNIRQIERKIQDLVREQGRHAAPGLHQEVPEQRDVAALDRPRGRARTTTTASSSPSTARPSSSSSRSSSTCRRA